jgi:hypothetical protein
LATNAIHCISRSLLIRFASIDSIQVERDKPRQGAVASTLDIFD